MAIRKWSDLTKRQKIAVLILGSIQLSMAAAAWADLAIRPKSRVNGPKALWAPIIGVNFLGPLAYLRWGRRSVEK